MAETRITAEPGRQDLVIRRTFDAARERVFKALTDPGSIPKWWGPGSLTTTVDKMEVKPGGLWRFVQRDPEGNEFAFHGVYHESVPPRRLVYTFEWEGMPGHVSLETITLEERDGKTETTDKVVFQSVEDRDGMLKSGMEEGAKESMDRLEALLRTMQKG
jgi:uncharacterized protein YndB with AHSA1/START domain